MDAMGITQHHDSAPGTEKQAVADDYDKRIRAGILANQKPLSETFSSLVAKDASVKNFEQCERSNSTYNFCPSYVAEDSSYFVSFLNPSLNRRSRPSFLTKGLPAGVQDSVTGVDVLFETICEPFE